METQVAIIGGGPCGLLTGLLLARLGVRCTVLEKHPDISFHPKATGITRRTGEIYRQLGLHEQMQAGDFKEPVDALSIWSKGLAGEILGTVRVPPDPPGLTPCQRSHCPQPHTEAVLRGALEKEPLAEVRYHARMIGFREDGKGVEIDYTELDSGNDITLRAQWLVAADGAESPARARLGIGTAGPGDLGRFLNIYFRASYGSYLEGRRAVLHQSLQEDSFGFFVAVNGADLWLMHHFLQEGEEPEDYSESQLREMVIAASGLPKVPVELIHVSPWVMSPKVATELRKGRCFLTGDAAARLSPSGGLGMNTGMASAHNLAWKLAAVVHGQARQGLLDTYAVERIPAAQATFSTSLGNSEEVGKIVEAGLTGHWDQARELIGHSRRAGTGLGLDLGFAYVTGALVPDHTEVPAPEEPVNDYVPSARPGCRAPHLEITVDGKTASTLDFFGRGFCLLCGEEGENWLAAWEKNVAEIGPGLAFDVKVQGKDFDGGAFTELYGISPKGAVLVRPDGYVAARWHDCEPESLTPALRQVLCLS